MVLTLLTTSFSIVQEAGKLTLNGLVPGEGVWWEKTPTGYHFFDGDDDPEQHSEGPLQVHFNPRGHFTTQRNLRSCLAEGN